MMWCSLSLWINSNDLYELIQMLYVNSVKWVYCYCAHPIPWDIGHLVMMIHFSINWVIGHLAMMILFSINQNIGHLTMKIPLWVVLNDERGLCETNVVAWTISYDIGYASSPKSRTIEHWKVINSTTCTESNFFYMNFVLIWML
jgi:hypothetical protein